MILKNILSQIAESQKKEIHEAEKTVIRNLLSHIDVNSKFAIILTGIRRCGKSTLLRQLMLKQSNSNYFNFEDSRALNFDLSDFNKLEEVFNAEKSKYFYYDEIQNINRWEMYIRSALDKKFKLFITGSNATLMSRELGTKLTGRYLKYELFPFSYNEFLEFKRLKDSYKSANEYLTRGGFPEYLINYNNQILQTLFDDILTRDIIIRHKIRNSKLLKNIALYLISNIGNLYSYSGLAKIFEIKSRNTAQQYVSYLEDCYLFFSVPMFSYSLKKQAANPRKIYSIDNGMVNANTLSFTDNKGKLLENLVFINLRSKGETIFYYKNKRECDFVIKKLNKINQAIQVCYELTPDNQEREFEGLNEAMDYFKLQTGYIITLIQEETVKYKNKKIIIISLRKWLALI